MQSSLPPRRTVTISRLAPHKPLDDQPPDGRHTDILRIIKRLVGPNKVGNRVDQQPPLSHKLDRRLAHGHDIRLGDAELDRLVQPLLLYVAHNHPRTNVVDNLQSVEAQPAEAEQKHRLGRLDLTATVDGVVRRIDSIGRHGRLGGGHTFRHRDQATDIDGRVGRIVAVLSDARVVAVLADLGKVPRALGAVRASAPWDAVEGDDITLIGCQYKVGQMSPNEVYTYNFQCRVLDIGAKLDNPPAPLVPERPLLLEPAGLLLEGEEGVVAAADCEGGVSARRLRDKREWNGMPTARRQQLYQDPRGTGLWYGHFFPDLHSRQSSPMTSS